MSQPESTEYEITARDDGTYTTEIETTNDEWSEREIAALRVELGEKWRCEWAGTGNTGADGITVSDVTITGV